MLKQSHLPAAASPIKTETKLGLSSDNWLTPILFLPIGQSIAE